MTSTSQNLPNSCRAVQGISPFEQWAGTTDEAIRVKIRQLKAAGAGGLMTSVSIQNYLRDEKSWETIRRRSATLPQIPHCQEVVSRSRTLTVVDDGGARTAAQGIAAIERWGGPNCILVAGGRGSADYRAWADACAERVTPNNTVFVAGNATSKMRAALGLRSRGIRTYDTLPQAWRAAKKRAALFLSAVLLYSPAAERIDTGANPW